MANSSSILIYLFSLFYLTSCNQGKESVADTYFRYLNNNQSDSLQNLLADDFKITMTYTEYRYNRTDFFKHYLTIRKAYNEKSRILKTINTKEPNQLLIETNSDYLRYLKVKPPTWRVTVKLENKKIGEIIIDTTEASHLFFKEIKEKGNQFGDWLKKNYPNDTNSMLHETEGLFLKRLKEYVETK